MENRMDLSKLERDDLRNLLSKAKDEWVKYTNPHCSPSLPKSKKITQNEVFLAQK